MAGKTGPSRRTARGRMAELVETIGPPISSVPGSPDFVAQTLEVLPVGVLKSKDAVRTKPLLPGTHFRYIALCRCGKSGIKPFCDGSHKRSGFSAPSAPSRPRPAAEILRAARRPES